MKTPWDVPSSARLLARVACAVLGCLIVPAALCGQAISGRTLDTQDDVPISRASVRLVNSASQTVGSAVTDSAGRFVVSGGRAGQFRLVVEGLGYVPLTSDPISIGAYDTVRVELRISRDPVVLPSIAVEGSRSPINDRLARRGFYENREIYERKLGSAKFFSPEKMDSLGNPPLTRLIPGLPFYRVVSLGGARFDVRTRSGHPIMLYIDGVHVRQREETVDQLISAGSIGAVEVYWGANPHHHGPVIMVWTRTW